MAKTRCEMWRGEAEDGSEHLSSEDHAAVMGALLFPEKDKQAALAIQELDTFPGSGFMLLCFAFMPKNLAGRLDFASFGSFSCSSEEPFLNGETALWQHFLNAFLMIEHIQQCQCIRTEHVFSATRRGTAWAL